MQAAAETGSSDVDPGAESGPVLDAGHAYDRVADLYDNSYSDPKSRAEDRVIFTRLIEFGSVQGRVLDVGCGTGILLEKLPISPQNFVGIDPSIGMLKRAKAKFPQHEWRLGTAEFPDLPKDEPFDSIVSLYGSFSYSLEPELAVDEMAALLRPGGKIFIMACSTGHKVRKSYIMNKVGIHVERRLYRADQLRRLFEPHFENVQIQGFGWVLDHIPHSAPDWLFHAVMQTEMETVGRWSPDRCCYQVLTATKRG